MTLTPYKDNAAGLNQADAWHLLWRTGFGASLSDLNAIEGKPLSEVVELIVTQQPESGVYQSTQQLLKNVAIDTGEISDLKAWWLYRIHQTSNPLNERIVLMWHNHFATSFAKVKSVQHMSAQNELIREHSLGDFRAMLHGMSEDVAMLIWLDGNANRKRHPNENFAREVMELFSLGVGNYTEGDIKEAARAFTGWHVRNDEFWFNRLQHDTGNKNVLGKSGNLDGHDIVDICLEQPSCKEFLAEKLLKTFVTHTPTDAEITAVATSIDKHDFNVSAVMRELLTSTLFWNPAYRHSLIKSPLEFVMGTYRALDAKPNYKNAGKLLQTLGQDLFEPPSVKGWEGGRQWINSTSLIQRMNFVTELTTTDNAGRLENLDVLNKKLERGSGCSWPELLLGRSLSEPVATQLKSMTQQQAKNQSRHRIHFLLTLPDYQLC